MIKSDKIAIVKFIPRENSTVKFCALIAQDESVDKEGNKTPAGF
jgi:hypothetical protein